MNRRLFMQAILTAGAAPAIVRASSLIVRTLGEPYVPGLGLSPNEARARGVLLCLPDLSEEISRIGLRTTYRYFVPQLIIGFGLPAGVKVSRVWADGVELPASGWRRTERGILLENLDVTP